jgi:prefoldin subunit 5
MTPESIVIQALLNAVAKLQQRVGELEAAVDQLREGIATIDIMVADDNNRGPRIGG